MKKTHGSVALAGLLALALVVAGCASQNEPASGASGSSSGTTSSGSSGTSGTTGSGTTIDDTGNPIGSSGSAATSSSDGNVAHATHDASGSVGASGIAGATGSGADNAGMQDDRAASATRATPPATPNSTVLAIEIMPASAGVTEGDATMGASGAAGATGSAASGQSYRVTVRMDDGSTQVVTHNSTPDFRSGERVHVKGGAIVR